MGFFGDNGNGQMYNQMQFLLCYFSIVMHRQRNLLLICLNIFCLVFAASIFTSSVKKSGSSCNSVCCETFWQSISISAQAKKSLSDLRVHGVSDSYLDAIQLFMTQIYFDGKFSDRALLFVNFQNWHNR